MTNIELKNNIDTEITNKTTPLSITPSNVGEQLKSVVDYVDQKSNYKIYRAILNQTGTNAPVATISDNTIGDIVWSRSSQGTYLGTLAGAFPVEKTYYPTFGMSSSFNRIYINRISDDEIRVRTISEDLTANLDDELFNFPIEIIVYN